MVLILATFRLIGTNRRPPVRKGSAVRAGAQAEMAVGMPSFTSSLQKPTVASVPVCHNVRPLRENAGRLIFARGSYTKRCRRHGNASRHRSAKPDIRNARAEKARSHKRCEPSAYGRRDISAKLKHISRPWRRQPRSTWNGWPIGSRA